MYSQIILPFSLLLSIASAATSPADVTLSGALGSAPQAPSVPQIPQVPQVPQVPQTPPTPQAPQAPQVPQAPQDPSNECAAQPVLDACISSTTAIASSCPATDYGCLCQKHTDVLTCFNVCPNDPRRSATLSSQSAYCSNASLYPSSTSSAISYSPSSSSSSTISSYPSSSASTSHGVPSSSATLSKSGPTPTSVSSSAKPTNTDSSGNKMNANVLLMIGAGLLVV